MTERDAVDDADVIAALHQLPVPMIPRPVSDDIIAALRAEHTPMALVTPIDRRQRRPLAPLLLAGAAGVVGLLVAGTVLPSSSGRPEVATTMVHAGGVYSPATLSGDVKQHMAAARNATGQVTDPVPATSPDVEACADRMAILAPVEFVDFGTYQTQPVAVMVTRYILDPQYIHIWVVTAACDRIVAQSVTHGST